MSDRPTDTKRNLRHESHNRNATEGALVVFATFNFADTYSPLLFHLVRGGPDGSVEHIGDDLVCHLTDDAPNMPSLQQMHQLIAQSLRAQAKFFLLMDDIADIYFMGMDFSFIGRHHVPFIPNIAKTSWPPRPYPVWEEMEYQSWSHSNRRSAASSTVIGRSLQFQRTRNASS